MSPNLANGTKPVKPSPRPLNRAKVVYPPKRPYQVECGVCGFRWSSRGKGLFYKCPRCYREKARHDGERRDAADGC
jgi:tRNA(Ile2) C34 agmatinyltransferase TiaS